MRSTLFTVTRRDMTVALMILITAFTTWGQDADCKPSAAPVYFQTMSFTEHMNRLPQTVRRGVQELAASGEVSFIVLFGSRARGSAGPISDTDLAVATATPIARPSDLPLRYLPRLSGPGSEVDLVVLDNAPPALRFRVARDALPLWVGDPTALHNFRVEAHRDWLDFEPFARSQLDAVRARISGSRFGGEDPPHG